jgi:hypothetical protein
MFYNASIIPQRALDEVRKKSAAYAQSTLGKALQADAFFL